MSLYSIVQNPIILSSSDKEHHLQKYVNQIIKPNSCIIKASKTNEIGDFEQTVTKFTDNLNSRPSTRAFLNYKRKINSQLSELNCNMSGLLRDSIMGIDNLCNKVRNCLMEIEDAER